MAVLLGWYSGSPGTLKLVPTSPMRAVDMCVSNAATAQFCFAMLLQPVDVYSDSTRGVCLTLR
jgi:hypothetical protein